MKTLTDHEHIQQVLAGNAHAYAHLVHKYKDLVFTVAIRMLKDRQEAEEASQDAFVKAYQHLGKFKGESKFSTWLYRIVYHNCLDQLKRKKRMISSELIDEIDQSDINEVEDVMTHLESEERKQLIHQAIHQLLPQDNAVITLFYLEEFSIKEVSEILAISEGQVKVRLHRSRKKLYSILKDKLQPKT